MVFCGTIVNTGGMIRFLVLDAGPFIVLIGPMLIFDWHTLSVIGAFVAAGIYFNWANKVDHSANPPRWLRSRQQRQHDAQEQPRS